VGAVPVALVSAHVDGDGELDFVTANGDASVGTLLEKGTGTSSRSES
jgi:hypothetical protein